MGVSRQIGVVVLQDNQIAIAAQSSTDINYSTIGRRDNRVTNRPTNVQAFVLDFVKTSQYRSTTGRPNPGNFVITSTRLHG